VEEQLRVELRTAKAGDGHDQLGYEELERLPLLDAFCVSRVRPKHFSFH
jgi:hypothetical protein